LAEIKMHRVFMDIDFTVGMRDRFLYSTAPFVPEEPVFNEHAVRNSDQMAAAKPANLLAAIMGNNSAADGDKGVL